MSAGQQLVHQARDDCYRNTRHRKFSLEDEIMIITCESTNTSKRCCVYCNMCAENILRNSVQKLGSSATTTEQSYCPHTVYIQDIVPCEYFWLRN